MAWVVSIHPRGWLSAASTAGMDSVSAPISGTAGCSPVSSSSRRASASVLNSGWLSNGSSSDELLQRKIVVKMLISALQLEVMLDRRCKQRTARSHPPSSRSVVTGTKRRRQVYQANQRSVR